MSSSVDGTKITLTRGDTLRVIVNITKDGEEYMPTENDAVRFALKHSIGAEAGEYDDAEPLILKDIPADTMILQLDPEDTKALKFGVYDYDIQITFEDGTVDTFITKAKFKLTPEVE